jgi:AcrR family transcriptional regulator
MKYLVAKFHNLCYSKSMNGFQRRREQKMKAILSAAFELFSSQGLKEASIAEIAGRAGVSQVSIYNYFQSKENLVRQTIFAFLDEKMKQSEQVLESEIPFYDKLEKLFFLTEEARDQANPEFLLTAIGDDPLTRRLMAEYNRNRTEPFIMRLIKQGKDQGAISRDLSDEAIRLYIQALQGILAQPSLSRQARLDIDELFFYGLQGKSRAF